jgi:hypothetical protein
VLFLNTALSVMHEAARALRKPIAPRAPRYASIPLSKIGPR